MAPGRRNLCWYHGRAAVAPDPRSADSFNSDDDTRIEGQSTTPSARRLEPDVDHRTNRSSDRWFCARLARHAERVPPPVGSREYAGTEVKRRPPHAGAVPQPQPGPQPGRAGAVVPCGREASAPGQPDLQVVEVVR